MNRSALGKAILSIAGLLALTGCARSDYLAAHESDHWGSTVSDDVREAWFEYHSDYALVAVAVYALLPVSPVAAQQDEARAAEALSSAMVQLNAIADSAVYEQVPHETPAE